VDASTFHAYLIITPRKFRLLPRHYCIQK
jgi:hypothetical protein